jgi:hypothetical protein
MNTVVLHPLGFAVEDDFGPEGRRAVMAANGGDTMGVLIFHGRMWAEQYAAARDAQAAEFNANGYSEREWELREACKRIARERGRIYS